MKRNNSRSQKIKRAKFGIIIWISVSTMFSALPAWWVMTGHINVNSSMFMILWLIPVMVALSIFMIINNCGDIHFNKQSILNETEHNKFIDNTDFNKKMDDIENELNECRELKKQMKALKEQNVNE